MIALALDGPFNGHYLSDLTAKSAGYELIRWPTGEDVWVEANKAFVEPTDFETAIVNADGTLTFKNV